MIIIKLKVNKQITADHWKQMAIGTPDEYGNPFRIAKLRWTKNPMHKMAEYTKTRGFEDAIISQDRRTGDISVSYRRSGSIMWTRPIGGVGPFMGEVPVTPKNLQRLAAMYGDKLWTIMDADIDKQVRAMYEKMRSEMTPEQIAFDDRRIRGMHRSSLEKEDKEAKGPEIPLAAEKLSIAEQNRLNQLKAMDLAKREEALNMKEAALNSKVEEVIERGGSPVTYGREYLAARKIHEIRKIAKEVGTTFEPNETKEAIITKIIQRQEGKKAEAVTAAKELEESLDI